MGIFKAFVFKNGLLVIGCRLSFNKGYGSGRAGGETVPETVTIIIPHKLGLSVHHRYGSLMASRRAGAAAVAFFRIDIYDPSFHKKQPFLIF